MFQGKLDITVPHGYSPDFGSLTTVSRQTQLSKKCKAMLLWQDMKKFVEQISGNLVALYKL